MASTRPTPQQWRKRIYQGISAHFGSSGEFRCVLAVNLFRAGTRWMSFFFPEYFQYLHIFIFGVLDDHDSPNFSLQDHPSLPFNSADDLGRLSFLFLFSFQQATPCFLYILERLSHFILKWDKFLFFGQKGERIGTCTSTELTFFVFLQGIKWIVCIYSAPSSFDTWCGTELTLAFYIYKYIYFFF